MGGIHSESEFQIPLPLLLRQVIVIRDNEQWEETRSPNLAGKPSPKNTISGSYGVHFSLETQGRNFNLPRRKKIHFANFF